MYGQNQGPEPPSVLLLRSLLKKLSYLYEQQALTDASKLIGVIPTLQPTSVATQNGTLLALEGTIPMYFQTRRYNIPVRVVLLREHPVAAPMAFVVPTPDMMIKPKHKHVAAKDGRVYLPYLSTWNHQKDSLYDLINIMSATFGQDPPVFKRPDNQSAGTGNSFPPSSSNSSPNPSNTNFMPQPMGGSFNPLMSYGMGMGNPNPNPMMGSNMMMNPLNPNMGMGMGMGSQFGNMGMGQLNQIPNTNVLQPQQFQPKQKSKEEIALERKNELLKRVRERVEKITKTLQADVNKAIADQRKVKTRLAEVENQEEQATKRYSFLENAIKEKEQTVEKMIASIEQMNGKEVDVDSVIKIQDVHSKQFIQLNAEIMAIDEAHYVLDKSAEQGVISLAEWERKTRKLAEEQFYKKALLLKVNAAKRK